nr:hypothetical protein Itr_chr09CG15850 [Ipomoea trifida]
MLVTRKNSTPPKKKDPKPATKKNNNKGYASNSFSILQNEGEVEGDTSRPAGKDVKIGQKRKNKGKAARTTGIQTVPTGGGPKAASQATTTLPKPPQHTKSKGGRQNQGRGSGRGGGRSGRGSTLDFSVEDIWKE